MFSFDANMVVTGGRELDAKHCFLPIRYLLKRIALAYVTLFICLGAMGATASYPEEHFVLSGVDGDKEWVITVAPHGDSELLIDFVSGDYSTTISKQWDNGYRGAECAMMNAAKDLLELQSERTYYPPEEVKLSGTALTIEFPCKNIVLKVGSVKKGESLMSLVFTSKPTYQLLGALTSSLPKQYRIGEYPAGPNRQVQFPRNH